MPSIDEKISKLRLHPRKYIVLEKGDKDYVSLEDVTRIFRLIPEERAKDHGSIDLVAKYLMNQSKLRAFWRMHEYTDDEAMSRLIATKAIFVDKPFKGSVIFNAGDATDYFYYVLAGSVNIVASFKRHSALSVVARIQAGGSFGSLGFLREENKRTAGAVTSSVNTKLLAFPKSFFTETFVEAIRKKHNKNYQIMRNTKVFQEWSDEKLRRLASITHEKDFMPGSHIAVEGHNVDNRAFLYIVVHGEVDMVKSLDVKDKSGKRNEYNLKLASLGSKQVFCATSLIKKGSLSHLRDKCLSDRGQYSHSKWPVTYKVMTVVKTLVLSKHGFFELADEDALKRLRMFAPPIPSDSMLRDTFKETQKWHTYKDRLQFELFLKMKMETQRRIKSIMQRTQKQLTEESQERKKELNHIEQLHENEEEAQYRRDLQVYRPKQTHHKLSDHLGKVRAVTNAMTLTSKFHHQKHLSTIKMSGHYVNDEEFEKLEKFFSNSLSSISENVRGAVTLPYAPVFLEKTKARGNIFKTYSAPSDAYYKQNGRYKTDEEIQKHLLRYGFEPAVEYRLKYNDPLDEAPKFVHKKKQSATIPPKRPGYMPRLKTSPLKKSRRVTYKATHFMNMHRLHGKR